MTGERPLLGQVSICVIHMPICSSTCAQSPYSILGVVDKRYSLSTWYWLFAFSWRKKVTSKWWLPQKQSYKQRRPLFRWNLQRCARLPVHLTGETKKVPQSPLPLGILWSFQGAIVLGARRVQDLFPPAIWQKHLRRRGTTPPSLVVIGACVSGQARMHKASPSERLPSFDVWIHARASSRMSARVEILVSYAWSPLESGAPLSQITHQRPRYACRLTFTHNNCQHIL